MKHITNYQNKKVLVLGAGLSGIYGAKLLSKLGAKVTITDTKTLKQVPKVKDLVHNYHVIAKLGTNNANVINYTYDLLVKSPGIPYTNPIVEKAWALHIPITVEVEIASEVNPGKLYCITGSNGKTTTTMLITRMLNHHFQNQTEIQNPVKYRGMMTQTPSTAYDAGNIGISASNTAQKMTKHDIMAMEISSFMLASITKLHPHFAVITNIYANHLDWHHTRANYIHDKMNITKNQNSNDYLVMNFNRQEWRDLSHQTKAQVIPFCTNGYTTKGAYEQNGKLYFRKHYIMDAKDIHIHGQYNVENALAAIAVAKMNGCTNQDIKSVLTTFKGASNRNQYVTTINHRIFFNDSKSTDVESTQAAVNSFKQPEILLLGGLDRGYTMKTFKKLIPYIKKHVYGIVSFGQTTKLMTHLAKVAGIKHIATDKTIAEAVKDAYQMSQPNNVILLSPANASWDQYPNFEVRGKAYRQCIQKLNHKKEL